MPEITKMGRSYCNGSSNYNGGSNNHNGISN